MDFTIKVNNIVWDCKIMLFCYQDRNYWSDDYEFLIIQVLWFLVIIAVISFIDMIYWQFVWNIICISVSIILWIFYNGNLLN